MTHVHYNNINFYDIEDITLYRIMGAFGLVIAFDVIVGVIDGVILKFDVGYTFLLILVASIYFFFAY